MKKNLFVLLVLFSLVPFVFADDGDNSPDPTTEKLVPNRVSNSSVADGGKLVNLDVSRTSGRIEDLRRQIVDLQQENKFQDDRIRSLERIVSDLQRRRN